MSEKIESVHTKSERRRAASVFRFSPGAMLYARFRLAVGRAWPELPSARDFRERGERLRREPRFSTGGMA